MRKYIKQTGLAHTVLIVAIIAALVSGFAAYRFVTVRDQNAITEQQQEQQQEALETVEEDVPQEEQQASNEESTEGEESTPPVAPPATTNPAPEAEPVANDPNITPLTADDCTGTIVAYGAKEGGAPASYKSPSNQGFEENFRINYGEKVEARCYLGGVSSSYPGYFVVRDAWVKASDLSSTKPN